MLSKIYSLVIIGLVLQKVCWKYILIIHFGVCFIYGSIIQSTLDFMCTDLLRFKLSVSSQVALLCRQSMQDILFCNKHTSHAMV
jgi:hypothetical protein